MQQPEMIRLMDHARIRVPGAVDAALLIELFAVMKEFFIETNTWREKLEFTALPTTASYSADPDAFTYDLLPTQGSIARLLAVTDKEGRPVRATMPQPGTVVLSTAPMSEEVYTAHVVLTVSDPTTRDDYPQFPLWVLNRYFAPILDGLLGRMMSQIAKPYSSPAIAMAHLRNFRKGMSQARVDAKRQNVYAAPTWRFPRGFAN
jgi:hypothetical protein